ncbi:MAG: hypothetical protein ACFFDS_07335, partial [Candidatus Thorarchaeota archaeon]
CTEYGRYYLLEALAFADKTAWSWFHVFSLGSLVFLILFLMLTKKPLEIFNKEMLYTFGAYLTMVGLTLFALGCMSNQLFEISSLTTLFFGVILWLSTLLEKLNKISTERSSLLKGIGSLVYFLGVTITTFRNFSTVLKNSPLNYLYNIVIVTNNNVVSRSFLPTFPDWIFGGLIWLILAIYWTMPFLQEKGVFRRTAKSGSILLSTAVVIYAFELLILGFFFINFGKMQGASIVLMFVGSLIGILASITIFYYLTIKWKLFKKKPKKLEPATLVTDESQPTT